MSTDLGRKHVHREEWREQALHTFRFLSWISASALSKLELNEISVGQALGCKSCKSQAAAVTAG